MQADIAVWRKQISIAHLDICITCDALDCIRGISALTALFPVSDRSIPGMIFSINSLDGLIKLSLAGTLLWQGKDAGEVVAAFEYALYNRVVGALYPSLISLHASTVSTGDTCVTCAGISGAGKSSLCTEALLQGASYLSDEFTLLDETGCITPFPRPLQWGSEEHPAFSHEMMLASGLFKKDSYSFPDREGNTVTSLLWHPERLTNTSRPMRIVLFPRYDATASVTTLAELRRSQGMMELATHVHHPLPPADRIRLLHAWVPAQTVFYRLVFSDAHAAWKQVKALHVRNLKATGTPNKATAAQAMNAI